MTRRMTQLIVAGALVVVLTASIILGTRRKPVDDRGVCEPENTWLPYIGWPEWDVCGDSVGFHTCWRPAGHGGRHTEWDLSTGKVTATWPCGELRA